MDMMVELDALQFAYRAVDTRQPKDAAKCISFVHEKFPGPARAGERIDLFRKILAEPAVHPGSLMDQAASRAILNELNENNSLFNEARKDLLLRERLPPHFYKDQTVVQGHGVDRNEIMRRRTELLATRQWLDETLDPQNLVWVTPVAELKTRRHDPLLESDVIDALHSHGIFSATPAYVSRHACQCVEVHGQDVQKLDNIITNYQSTLQPKPARSPMQGSLKTAPFVA